MGESIYSCIEAVSATCEVKTERANECRLLCILHSRGLDVKELKWIYIVLEEIVSHKKRLIKYI